jgi:hypothetical protein
MALTADGRETEGPASCWEGCRVSPAPSRPQLFQGNGTCAAKCRRKCLILDWELAADGVSRILLLLLVPRSRSSSFLLNLLLRQGHKLDPVMTQ